MDSVTLKERRDNWMLNLAGISLLAFVVWIAVMELLKVLL